MQYKVPFYVVHKYLHRTAYVHCSKDSLLNMKIEQCKSFTA